MKNNAVFDHVYINDALVCSTISINTNITEQNGCTGGLQGSNEYILTNDSKKIITPIKAAKCVKSWLQFQKERTFKKKILHKRLPITNWLPKYSTDDAIGDLVAGLTVGLTVIPQALAYAGIAGLPAAYGLYGSFLGCFIYIFFGSCKDVPIGPSAIVALLTFQAAKGSWQKSVLLSLLTGIVELFMGLCSLGFLIDFVSGPVSSGFTSAVSLVILTSQIKDILGVTAKGTSFIEIWTQIFKNINQTQLTDCILGCTCIVVLMMMRYLAALKIGPQEVDRRTKAQKIVNKILWIIGTSRNAILVVFCCAMGYILHSKNEDMPFKVIGFVPSGLPSFHFPQITNETATGEPESFIEIVHSFGSGLIIIPLISLMESIAISKAFANGKPVDASQELIAIGLANIANSFVQGFPSTGALSRGAVNNASGVRTQFSNIYASALVILALLFFTPYFHYIPKATLAAIIISAVVFMIEIKVIKPMWRTKKSDLLPGLSTFFACLILPLEVGIMIGIGINIVFILYHAARPKITIETLITTTGSNEYLIITPDRCLIFPSVEYLRNLVNKHSKKNLNLPVVIDASHVFSADFTTAKVMDALLDEFARRNQLLFFYNLKPSICTLFESFSNKDFHVFYHKDQLDELLKAQNYEQRKAISV